MNIKTTVFNILIFFSSNETHLPLLSLDQVAEEHTYMLFDRWSTILQETCTEVKITMWQINEN